MKSWVPLRNRLSQLPLILAGPMLRHTEPDTVTVWVALQTACHVTLEIYATEAEGTRITQQLFQGDRSTVAIGKYVHLVAVTAKANGQPVLQPGCLYAYNLQFAVNEDENYPSSKILVQEGNLLPLQAALTSSLLPQVPISYFAHQLPTFALPPANLHQVKLAHGSCRKLHGKGQDTLPILDDWIQTQAGHPDDRLHQLFLTGDQIYGDDVADPLLWQLTEAGDSLLGWQEALPLTHSAQVYAEDCLPGQRSTIAEQEAGFTAGLPKQAEYAKSHLFSLGEYMAIYLFSWSQTLWTEPLPAGEEFSRSTQYTRLWQQDTEELTRFTQTLWKVRRLVANVPTYMIFDDHDISDDWYLNQAWCLRVLGKPLGKRVVQNGLLAYALCQAWGNTPAQFQPEQVGATLLQAATTWVASAGTDTVAHATIERCLGLPPTDSLTGLPQMQMDQDVLILAHDPQALNWHYTIRTSCYEVLVLDTRTWRGYPAGAATPVAPPMLLSPTAFERQIREPLEMTDRLIEAGQSTIQLALVIAPTNLVSLQLIDWVQHRHLERRNVFEHDVGDAWNVHKAALAELLSTLFEHRDRVVILSGDIHYGAMVRLDYWTLQPQPQPHVLAQLTSSALKNSEWKTRVIHTKAKSLLPERNRSWIAWHQSHDIHEVRSLKPYLRPAHPASKLDQSPPDWGYSIAWVKRQPAQPLAWANLSHWRLPSQRRSSWSIRLYRWIAQLWRNRWWQEGHEVVGLNNIGLVRFQPSSEPDSAIVIQDLFWYAPWNPNRVVSSRFQTSLDLGVLPSPPNDRRPSTSH
ncbi:PhoD-like phosphatase [Pantanalinema sp. GBBB05]|uniref:PhoD-like phosphatase n=1 Tax=Pantanalinema sp. GBBB05 TaxID=2604139 RepID=UPI001DDAF025|nr:PhoD-like phosphatase [Pantanalinema sp. GBBB05]